MRNNNQTIPVNGLVNFNFNYSLGNGITFNGTDTFTLNQLGLYSLEYNVTTAENSGNSVFNIIVNGLIFSSAGNPATSGGNLGGGSVIQVSETPTTVQLQNGSIGPRDIVVTPGTPVSAPAASIRINRYADGPSV